MFSVRLEKFVWQHRRVFSVLIVSLVIQLFELVLLQIKYNIFTGGFLQPYAYKSFSERGLFFLISLWYDFLLLGLLGAGWFYLSDRLNKFGIIIYYSFTVFFILLMGIWLGLKFKVLSYFNDTINYQIIANLGGGSLKNGLLYATNEIAIFIVLITIFVVIFIFSIRQLKNHQFIRDYHCQLPQVNILKWILFIIIIFTPFLTYNVSGNDFLRYGLEKTTSYRLICKALDALTDFDGDGYSIFNYPKDFSLFNGLIYPGALDIPGNLIDEDGLLGDAKVVSFPEDSLRTIKPHAGKHIILIVLETARFNLLEQQIEGQYVAPVMREIARTGTSTKYAYSHTGYTTTSLIALFNRELIPHDNRVRLIDFLQSSGYGISIISGQDESFGDVATITGMKNEGVYYFDARTAIEDRVFPSKDPGSLRLSEERVVEQFQKRFKELDLKKPQFIYLNFQAAHFPYSHPNMQKRLIKDFVLRSEIVSENRKLVADTYWNAIANADWAVGEVVNALKMQKLYNQTTLVILGDHGESLFDDGFLGHGHAINEAQTHIPLLFNDSNLEISEAIGQVDVAEMAIRSAFGLPNKWVNPNKSVFQFVGTLYFPALIGHVKFGGDRIIFDFRSDQVFLGNLRQWKNTEELVADTEQKKRFINLISEWETLKWNEHNYRQQTKQKRPKTLTH